MARFFPARYSGSLRRAVILSNYIPLRAPGQERVLTHLREGQATSIGAPESPFSARSPRDKLTSKE